MAEKILNGIGRIKQNYLIKLISILSGDYKRSKTLSLIQNILMFGIEGKSILFIKNIKLTKN